MRNLTQSRTAKILGLFVAVVMLGGVGAPSANAALTEAQIQSILSLLQSFGADAATITNVSGSLRGKATPGTTGSVSSTACPYVWTKDLKVGSKGNDVMKLQMFLNTWMETKVAASGAGSPGYEGMTFGPATKAAVAKFQNKYASDTLTPIGLTVGSGYFGALSRAKANSLCSGTVAVTPPAPVTPGTPVVTPMGSGLTITKSANQPVNSLAPENAARVPFTNIDLTASADGDVTVNSIVVERQGVAADTAFTGIVLMNADGTLIGIEKTLNSNHQATIGKDFVVPAGTTKMVTVATNMDTTGNLGGESGQTPSFAVVAVNTSATVHGSLPFSGASHTVNSSLAIGSISVARGGTDPGANQTKEVGLKGYVFSAVKFTAGSAEDVTLKSIRWYQSQSASADDIANIKTTVDGVDYDVVKDGRYYQTLFPDGGLLIKKGFNKDISIKADIVGGSGRLIDFDIDRRTDVSVVGNQYGYGIIAPFGDGTTDDASAFRTTNNPYYDAAQVTISAGTMNVSTWTAGVPAQNIAVNLAGQPILGLTFDVKGEPISVGSMVFDFTLGGTQAALGLSDVTNVTLVNENGSVLSGPADGSGATIDSGSITLSDSVTFPVGITHAILKAKLGTDFVSNNTVQASTTPGSTSYFKTVTGQVTGNTITPAPTSALTGSSQTVKAGDLSVTVATQPSARTVIAGANKFEFARYILDASQSGEDVRVTTIPLDYSTSGTATDLTSCQLFDGIDASSPSVTSGSNTKNPSAVGSTTSFTFDGTGLLIPKGTAKTLSLRCNIKTGTTATYYWGLVATADNGGYTGASGVTSGQTIAEVFNRGTGQRMVAAANGSYTVINDTSVLFRAVQAGATDVVLAKYRFDAGSTESVDIKGIALSLGNIASNTPSDLLGQKVTIWNGATQVGIAQFGLGVNPDFATSTLSTPVRVPVSDSVTLTVKGSLATQDVNSSAGAYGAVLSVNYDGDNNGLNGNYASGADSGATINGTSADTAANAVKIYRGLISVQDVTTTTSLAAGADLYRIQLTAASGRDVLIRELTFDMSTVGLAQQPSGIQLFGPSGAVNANSVSSSTSAYGGIGGNEILKIIFDNAAVDRVIQAGTSKIFTLRIGTITTLTSANTETISLRLMQDTAEPSGVQRVCFYAAAAHMGCVNDLTATSTGAFSSIGLPASTTDRFIWSPSSTTTLNAAAASNDATDWTNGYGLPGFPTVGQDMPTRVFIN